MPEDGHIILYWNAVMFSAPSVGWVGGRGWALQLEEIAEHADDLGMEVVPAIQVDLNPSAKPKMPHL